MPPLSRLGLISFTNELLGSPRYLQATWRMTSASREVLSRPLRAMQCSGLPASSSRGINVRLEVVRCWSSDSCNRFVNFSYILCALALRTGKLFTLCLAQYLAGSRDSNIFLNMLTDRCTKLESKQTFNYCVKNNLNLHMKTDPVTAGMDATINVQLR